ncbi:Arrestin domain-containing protein 3 [Bulinus truncatus]|nr:Arrestin domain-containing protein 3 [Bulinus truncatus]
MYRGGSPEYEVLSLTRGDNSFSYSFQLPYDGLPSSYEGFYGSVRYCLRTEVDRPFPSINIVYNNCFTVLAHLDANDPQFLRGCSVSGDKVLSKFLGLGTAGSVHLVATLDRSGYCPGEMVLINLEARNDSSKDCGAVKASLIQRVHFKASYSKQTRVTTVRTIVDRNLAKGEIRSWQQMKFVVDPVPPTTKLNTCQIIQVNYSLKITVEVPLGFDLELDIPITICSVPLGKPLANLIKPDFSENEGQNMIRYTQCTTGISVFPKGDTDFPYASYKPMTAFVSNN